jgi:antitoxin YefM
MSTSTTYSAARASFAKLFDRVVSTREPVIIHRRNHEDVALVSASELESLMETAHLLRSPKNTERLVSALAKARQGEGKVMTVDALRKEMGVG